MNQDIPIIFDESTYCRF